MGKSGKMPRTSELEHPLLTKSVPLQCLRVCRSPSYAFPVLDSYPLIKHQLHSLDPGEVAAPVLSPHSGQESKWLEESVKSQPYVHSPALQKSGSRYLSYIQVTL